MILIYHSVHNKGFVPFNSIPLNLFDKQMRFLSKYRKVGSLYEYRKGKCNIVITFDDGYKNNYTHAYPLLKKYGLTATFFLTTGLIGTKNMKWDDKISYLIQATNKQKIVLDKREYMLEHKEQVITEIITYLNKKDQKCVASRLKQLTEQLGDIEADIMMSWDNVKEMSKDGMYFGSHTVTHSNLVRISLEQVEAELVKSKTDIEQKLGIKVDVFSYTYGGLSDINEAIVKLLRKHGFILALLNDCSNNDGFSLPRYSPPKNLFLFKMRTTFPRLYSGMQRLIL